MITTVLSADDLARYSVTTDQEINDTLTEANKRFAGRLLISEHEKYIRPRWWMRLLGMKMKRTGPVFFKVMWKINGDPKDGYVQILNFYMPGESSSFGMYVPKEMVLAYLYGKIGGFGYRQEIVKTLN